MKYIKKQQHKRLTISKCFLNNPEPKQILKTKMPFLKFCLDHTFYVLLSKYLLYFAECNYGTIRDTVPLNISDLQLLLGFVCIFITTYYKRYGKTSCTGPVKNWNSRYLQ